MRRDSGPISVSDAPRRRLAVDVHHSYIWPALFECLVSSDPVKLEPLAGLATHYQVDPGLAEFTFFLRGHRNPRGAKLPGGDFEHDAAMWSDGQAGHGEANSSHLFRTPTARQRETR
jgi:hypothetical protein